MLTLDPLLDFHRRPSTAAFMARALWPSRTRSPDGAGQRVRWSGHRVDPEHLAAFHALTGLARSDELPLLYPHVMSFPLLMALLTHPAFPFPIWRVLQVRNQLTRVRSLSPRAVLDLEVAVVGRRALDKGVEVDLRTTVSEAGSPAWESLNTFYTRARARGPTDAPAATAAPPPVPSAAVAEWRLPAGRGLRFAQLTGDYNGIHWWSAYARRMGFTRAFHHPQLVLGQCLARLSEREPGAWPRLDTWLRGPVYDGSRVELRAATAAGATTFAVVPEGDSRPAILAVLEGSPTGGPS